MFILNFFFDQYILQSAISEILRHKLYIKELKNIWMHGESLNVLKREFVMKE